MRHRSAMPFFVRGHLGCSHPQIGEYKKNNNIAILQTSRWDSILAKVVNKGAEYGLPKEFIEDVFNAIHETSVEIQNEVISGRKSM